MNYIGNISMAKMAAYSKHVTHQIEMKKEYDRLHELKAKGDERNAAALEKHIEWKNHDYQKEQRNETLMEIVGEILSHLLS